MHAAALQLHGFSVDLQASHRVGRDRPDPGQHFRLVCRLCILFLKMRPESAGVRYPDFDPVQVRMLRVPENRIRNGQRNPCRFPAPGAHMDDPFRGGGDLTGILTDQYHLCLRQPVFRLFIADLRFGFQEGIPVRHFPGIGKNAVRCDMHLRPVQEKNASVQPGARIPPGIRLHAGIDVDRNPVLFPVGNPVRQIRVERRVSVMLHAYFGSVDLHGSVHHRSVKQQSGTAVLPIRGDQKFPGIVAQSPGKVPHIRPGRSIRRYRRPDHPVMGQVHHRPGILLQHGIGIQESSSERPFFVNTDPFHFFSSRGCFPLLLFCLSRQGA